MKKKLFVFFCSLVICWILVGLFRLPIWSLYLCIILIGLFQIIWTQSKNFKALKKLLPIPQNGYDKAKKELLEISSKLDQNEFELVDEFFVDGTTKVIAKIYLNTLKTSFLSIYHLQTAVMYEFNSVFENDITLATCSSINSGLFPRPSKRFLVISDRATIPHLYKSHKDSIDYLIKNGLKLKELTKNDYRNNQEKEERELSEYRKSKSFFSIRTIYWLLTKRGKIHWQTISEQHKKGIIRI